ncbi:ThiF family adenylyltransferase [Flavobacterium sp.]|uniref:ThiF family adenylyltransferase n=1 Tax=Flavobacterium sp. TaxID=239 RepID=UPI0039E5DE85
MMEDVFKYPDTNSSRAGIAALNDKFESLKIAIIGLGGTGSYILDAVAKTNVKEIHLFDGDTFQLHNAFRAPGAFPVEVFEQPDLMKVDHYAAEYSNLRNGIVAYPVYVNETNIEQFSIYDFVFISVDSNKARSFITKSLLRLKVPFIDVGMGINRVNESLIGTIRVTVGTPEKHDHLEHRIGEDEVAQNEYTPNIQIAELNNLNAMLAVIRWKKMFGFYQDLKMEFNSLYMINTGKLINEDFDIA